MTGSNVGALRSAANRIGVPFEEYQARREAGEQWCSGCRVWHLEGLFAGRKRGYCAESYRRRNNEATQRREREFLNHLLARLLVK